MADHDPLCPYRDEPFSEAVACPCPLIARVRGDERAKPPPVDVSVLYGYDVGRSDALADLANKVEGLVAYSTRMEHEWDGERWVVLYADVLALIDEARP